MAAERQGDPQYYWRALGRRKWLVALVTCALGVAGLAYSLLQPRVYSASAQVLIDTEQSRSLFNPGAGSSRDLNRDLQTQIGVLKSETVRRVVEKQLPGAPNITAGAVAQTDIVAVTAESTDRDLAARTANAYARAYVDFRRRQAAEDLQAAGGGIQKKIDDLDAQITALDLQLEGTKVGGAEGRAGSIRARQDSLIAQQAQFRQRLNQLQIDVGLSEPDAQLVSPATTPTKPITPRPVENTAFAVLAGLVLGSALGLLRDRLDDTIKTKDDAEQAVPGVAVLATVPSVPAWKDRGRAQMISVNDPNAPAAEAYRSLRTAIQFMSLERPLGAIQFTSPDAGEGKSTTVANMAVTMARTGKRVVVVCCDLRRPRVHQFFELEDRAGFTSVLLGDVTLEDALQVVENEPNIAVLSAGPAPPNPSELLSSWAAAAILHQLKEMFDFVLVDCPPVLPVTDAMVVAGHVDATVLLAGAGSTTRSELRETVKLLRQVDAPLVGLVLNGVRRQAGYSATYAYSSSSNGAKAPGKRRAALRASRPQGAAAGSSALRGKIG